MCLDCNIIGIVIFVKYGYIYYLFFKGNLKKIYICFVYGKIYIFGIIEVNIRWLKDSIIIREVVLDGKYVKIFYEVIN